jgi:hypothetical protein
LVSVIPVSERSVVVLPAPLAPNSVVMPPLKTSMSMPYSTWTGP